MTERPEDLPLEMDEPEPESETIPLPKGWDQMANGEPMPDVAEAVRRSRESH
jgi:hypothetical protein